MKKVPFNDLSRIHEPIHKKVFAQFSKVVQENRFVLNKEIGIEFSTGSLGMGLSIGIGLAIASERMSKNFKTFVLLGDGECNEGSVWEAAMSVPNLNIKNLSVIIDRNNFQQTGTNKNIMNIDPIDDKWKSFGWDVNIVDGHNVDDLINYFENIDFNNLKTYPKDNLMLDITIFCIRYWFINFIKIEYKKS